MAIHEKEQYVTYSHEEYGSNLLIFSHLVLFAVLRYIIKAKECAMSYAITSLILGLMIGISSMFSPVVDSFCQIEKSILAAEPSLYLPMLIFGTAFTLDVHTFLKSLHQIFIIAVPVSLLSAILTGSLMRLIIAREWSVLDGVFFGTLFISVYPFGLLRWLEETGTQTKCVYVLFAGETLVGNVFGFYVYQTISLDLMGWSDHWEQVLVGTARLFFVGIGFGCIFGLIGSCLMRTTFSDSLHLALITIVMCYSSFYLCEALSSTGLLACLITGIMMAVERTSLPGEMERFIKNMWQVLMLILNGTIFLVTGIMIPRVLEHLWVKDYMLVFVTYLLCNVTRFIAFMAFGPILNRLGNGIGFKNMMICVWGGLRSPVTLAYAYNLLESYPKKKSLIFFLHTSCVYLLYMIINVTFFPALLRLLNLSQLSITRQVTMNNCMRYVLQARERTIAVLKMDRFLSDANWPLVMATTEMKHPYRKRTTEETTEDADEDEEYFMGYRFTECPDCKKRILNEPTNKEMREMTREAKIRNLKLRKIFFSRRYECGLLTKEGVRIAHQSVEVALDSEEKYIEIGGLIKMFTKESAFFRCVLRGVMRFFKTSEDCNKPPKNHFRFICFKVNNNFSYNIAKHVVTFCNCIDALYYLIAVPEVNTLPQCILLGCDFVIFDFFVIECLVKILAYSWLSIYHHGLKRYFSSCIDIIEFIVMCVTFLNLIINLTGMLYVPFGLSESFTIVLTTIDYIRLLRLICLLHILTLFKNLYPNVMRIIDLKIDRNRFLAYELGINYICGEEEVLENLPNIIDNDKIRNGIREQIEVDRLRVTRTFGSSQKYRPWVAVTTKTKLAIGAVLTGMKEDINELKTSGWMDDLEYTKLFKSIGERVRQANGIHSVQPLAPKLIMREVVWMTDDESIVQYLFDNLTSKKFDPGDVVCAEGELCEGIYVLISGMLMLNYTAPKTVMDKLSENGVLPVVDYVSYNQFGFNSVEYIIPGNSVGELSTLTERTYNCTITAETHSQAFVLKRDIMKQAMELDLDPINGLESRIWKSIALRFAISLLMNVAAYRSYTLQKLEFILERAFVPNISNVKVFVVNEMMEDILLIEGVAVDLNTRDVFTGPCYIPRLTPQPVEAFTYGFRSVQRLIMPRSSTLNMEVEVETKLMIVPAKDFDEYEIMLNAEQTCELISDSATKCLQHIVQDRVSKGSTKIKRRAGARGGKVSAASSILNKSKITFQTAEEEKAREEAKK